MTGPQLITQMRARCRVIEARLSEIEAQKATYQTSLMHHCAVLADMEADATGTNVPSNMSIRGHFKPGELFALCVLTLREHDAEQSTQELASRCLEAKGLDASDKLLRGSIAHSLIQVLKAKEAKGEIVAVGKRGRVNVWSLP